MKKLIALLLTLTLLLGMVGTVAVAADAASGIPEFTATIAKDGTVSVAISSGEPDFSTEDSYVEVFDSTKYWYTQVDLTSYNSEKKAYIGTVPEYFTADMVSEIHLRKYDGKTSTQLDASYDTWNEEAKGKLTNASKIVSESTTKEVEIEYTDKDGKKHKVKRTITTSSKTDRYDDNYYYGGKKNYSKHTVSEMTGDEKAQTVKGTEDTTYYDYEDSKKIESVKKSTTTTTNVANISEYGSISWEEMSRATKSNTYNAEDVLTRTTESKGETTYNTKKDARSYKYNSKTEEYSSKGFVLAKTKADQSSESKYVEKTREYGPSPYMTWETQSRKTNSKTTNRDGNLSRTTASEWTLATDGSASETETENTFNTYTGKLSGQTVTTWKWNADNTNNKSDEYWSDSTTIASTYNDDEGVLRYKIVKEFDAGWHDQWDYNTVTETHYNNKNQVVAAKDKEGTWTDGSGKVLGKNYSKDEESQSTDIYDWYFKSRTGELSHYSVTTTTTDKEGTKTEIATNYEEGKKTHEIKQITKKDDSSETYKDGVLRKSYKKDDKGSETKYFDRNGKLIKSEKYDNEKRTTSTYNEDGKLTHESNRKESTETEFDPVTGKMLHFYKYGTKNGTEYYNSDSKLVYSVKNDKNGNTIYSNADGVEFARTYSDSEKGVDQHFYSSYRGYGAPTYKETDVSLENVVTTEKEADKTTTTTKKYTKWDVLNGEKKNEVKRTDEEKITEGKGITETNKYSDGVLRESTVTVKNDYDDTVKTTTKKFDWYTGKATGTDKYIYRGIVDNNYDDPISYYKRYDRYDNLQTYQETDNTDNWGWTHVYYADGTLKRESWQDQMDGESDYTANYYLSGSPASAWSSTDDSGWSVGYNKDGTYSWWSETTDNVTNTYLFDRWGIIDGYRWNQQNKDGVESFDYYNENGTLLYSEKTESSDSYYPDSKNGEYGIDTDLAGGTVTSRTDPAGNKWSYNYESGTATLTLSNNGTGWQSAVGEWFYIENGKPLQEEWKQIGGNWYYFNEKGFVQTGLIDYANKKANDHDLQTWTVYAADSYTGAATAGGWTMLDKDGYSWAYTNPDGTVKTGWQNIDGKWYYFKDAWQFVETDYKADAYWYQGDGEYSGRGEMVTGAYRIWTGDGSNTHTYFFNEDGTLDTTPGWKIADDFSDIEYHYYNRKGQEVTGWNQIDGKWYYFNEDGVMKNGWVQSGTNWYYMDPKQGGAMANNGFVEDVYEDWYYMDKNGQYQTGWLQDNGKWYYLKNDATVAINEWAKYGNNWYYMGADGTPATGWVQDHGNWYYLKPDSTAYTGWYGSGSTWYYFGEDGAMAIDKDVKIGDVTYHFDENGVATLLQ